MQKQILDHRLEVPDAIGEAINDEREYPVEQSEIDWVCDLLLRGGYEEALHRAPRLTREVLKDAVTGSTYWGCTESEDDPLLLANVERAGKALAKKVSTELGTEVFFPTW